MLPLWCVHLGNSALWDYVIANNIEVYRVGSQQGVQDLRNVSHRPEIADYLNPAHHKLSISDDLISTAQHKSLLPPLQQPTPKPNKPQLPIHTPSLSTMPRGAEYADAPPASDNAIESGENKIAGAEVRRS